MKILLCGINSQYFHSNLAVRYLKTFIEDLDVECKIREFTINDRKEKLLEEIILEKPDIIGFSTYIWNVEMVSALSTLIKIVNPEIQIFYGGPEVSYDSKEFLEENSGEYVLRGEGEETFREFVEYKMCEHKIGDEEKKIRIKNIKGLTYKEEDEVKVNDSRENMDMRKIVFPYKKDEDLSNKIVYYEASRGCPFRCKYCLSSVDRKLRFLDIDRVKKELDYFINKRVKLVKFVDRTFNSNHDFASSIWEYLVNAQTDITFHFEISADLLNEKEIEILSRAPKGRFQFEVGVQTTNNETLRNINRFVNFENIAEKVEEVQELKNIMQHLDLIAGLPGEDYNSFRNSFNDVYKINPEEIQLGFLKLLKGSPMRAEAEKWGMKFSNYPPYEILKTNHITYEELLKLKRVESVVNKYYNSGRFNNTINLFVGKIKTPFDFYYDLGTYFKVNGYYDRNISNNDYYEILLKFNQEREVVSEKLLKNVLKYDYMYFNTKKYVPDFLREEEDKRNIKALREAIKEKYVEIDKNNIHTEKYTIDILKYINEGIEENKIQYLLYDLNKNGNITDVTELA